VAQDTPRDARRTSDDCQLEPVSHGYFARVKQRERAPRRASFPCRDGRSQIEQ